MIRGRRPGARVLAREVLRRVRRDGAYANLALATVLSRSGDLSAADRALVTELVYGVLRHRRRLDHAIAQRISRSLSRTDDDVLDALRVGAYQLLILDRIPAYAAIDETVAALRQLRGPKVAGFANAVLRRMDHATLTLGLPDDPVRRLAIEESLPDDLASYLSAVMGYDQARQYAHSLLERAALVVRVNRPKISSEQLIELLEGEGATVKRCRWSPTALRVSGLADPFAGESYLRGLWTAQDEAAQMVTQLLDPRPGEAVLDACAGVGGKAMHIAERMAIEDPSGSDGLLCADSSARKLELLAEHGQRLGVRCATRQVDLTQIGALDGRLFDRVLLDAPCSGLGVLRRHPELKWRWRSQAIDELAALQRSLLRTAVAALKPGGTLVYSVCTVTDQEGPMQLAWLLSEYAGLRLCAPSEAGIPADLVEQGTMRTWPHRHDMDGFFACRVVQLG